MRHLTQWHPEHKVPIVDGRFQDPNTGEIQQNTRTDTYLGPPSVHVMWFNVHDSSSFRGLGATFNASINEVFITIADHVRDGVYSIISLNASLYAVTVVCETDKAREEVGGVIQGMQRRLNRDVVIPEGELDAVRTWKEEMGYDKNDVVGDGSWGASGSS
ncbi:uncharacterized protein NFIA_106730 [Aspergillus fischeri NRRL 181]|uniref:Uncharacterized protein n=1 Tax=Neosartorya fischeri (strain ATCC 1020 / DSM 3700 / CBS 544.65 / FGSC A1164 / JCM 1740 / NRRL 181 / WB 181) TaxID=331117 RepID=A1CX33_NEOFI|nr:uncharacterized protein NFIA_106730 [Aspergillus fischeri NRRL 181]EAW25185.1 hypothetical protein NFIA_106730 [Aspergillus fischeri NRRL 181]